MECPLPAPQIIVAFAEIRRQQCQVEQCPVDDIGRVSERLFEINKKHHPRHVGFVPGLVLKSVVKNEHLALAPAALLGTYANSQVAVGVGDQKPQMKSKNSIVGTPV